MANEQTKDLTKYEEVEQFITKNVMVRAAQVLPESVNRDRFQAILISHFNRTPKLFDCTFKSIGRAVTQLAELNLEPTGTLGQASIIPYGDEATLVIEYGGYITLAHRSGRVRACYAREVYEKDHCVIKRGVHEDIDHVPYEPDPNDPDDDRGALKLAYAVIHYTNGGFQFETVNRKQIAAIKARLGNKIHHKDSPWQWAEPAMWCKSAIRKLQKYVPKDIFEKAPLLAEVMHREDVASGFIKPTIETTASRVDIGSFGAGDPKGNRGHDDTGFGDGKQEGTQPPEGASPGASGDDQDGGRADPPPKQGAPEKATEKATAREDVDLFGPIEDGEDDDPLMDGKNNGVKKRIYYLAKKHGVPTAWIAELIWHRYSVKTLAQLRESAGREVCGLIEVAAAMSREDLSVEIRSAMVQDATQGRTDSLSDVNTEEIDVLRAEMKVS